MQWETSLYRVTVQPNLQLDLNQIGVIQQNVRMNDEAAAGAIWMATNLFGKDISSHLRFDLWTGNLPSITQYHGSTIQVTNDIQPIHPSMFPAFLRQWVPFILEREELRFTSTDDEPVQELWTNYLHKIEAALGHVINPPYMTYNCRMINRQRGWSSIYQFITRSFVDGASNCVSWFGLPLDEYLDNIHLANIPLRREYIGSQS